MIECLLLALALSLQFGGGSDGNLSATSVPVPDSFIISALKLKAAAPPGSSAFVRFDLALDKTQSLVVRAFGLPAGTYDVVHTRHEDETALGSFTVGADGMGKLVPQPPAGADFLDWFEHSDTIDVRVGDEVLLGSPLDHVGDFLGGGSFASATGPLVNGARLIAVGDDLDARGRLVYGDDDDARTLDLHLERVAPGPYILEVGGLPELYVVAGSGGKADLRLSTPIQVGTGKITLYPVGESLRVLDAAGSVVLAAQLPADVYGELVRGPGRQKFHDVGEGAADGLSVDFVKTDFWYAGELARGSVAWQRDALGAASITLTVQGKQLLTGATLHFYSGETWIGDLLLTAPQGSKVLTATYPAPPDLDLRGQRLELRGYADAVFALVFPQSVPAGIRAYHKDLRKSHRLRLDLLNPGTDLDATGRLDWRLKKGVEQLQLVVRDLPAGAYDIVIDGEVVAAGVLLVDEDGGEAEQFFSTGGVLAGSLPLEFEVHGALEIRAAGAPEAYLQQDLGD
jgi:hypothetical protein